MAQNPFNCSWECISGDVFRLKFFDCSKSSLASILLCIYHPLSLVQAEYWQDPLNLAEYKTKSVFLADINQEQVMVIDSTYH